MSVIFWVAERMLALEERLGTVKLVPIIEELTVQLRI
jgi:hypothetical protein